jgi:citrate lyase subunit beta/citryl-CoA lyase
VQEAPLVSRVPRSWLFVPGDSERKQLRAAESAADALILDLEDSVASARLELARGLVAEYVRARRGHATPQLWVRVNSPASGQLLEDLVAVLPATPHGIVLPKVAASELGPVDHYLTALEAREGLAPGGTKLLVIATETPRALLEMSGYGLAPARLTALTWGAEDLGAALGSRAKAGSEGALTPPLELARTLCLVAAGAEVAAIDSVHATFSDAEGLARELERARRDGFVGKLAIHPAQVAAINAAFTPSPAEIEEARRILAAFSAAGDGGVVSLDGRMLDRPHRLQAERLLAAASAAATP